MKLDKLIKSIELFYKKALRSYELTRLAAPPAEYDDAEEYLRKRREEEEEDEEDEKDPSEESNYEQESFAGDPAQELMELSANIGDPQLNQTLRIISQLYKKSIEIGGGYSIVDSAINALIEEYDEITDTSIEYVLNEMKISLNRLVNNGQQTSPQNEVRYKQQLQTLYQNIKSSEAEQQQKQLSSFEEEANVAGATKNENESLTETGLDEEKNDGDKKGQASSVFDMSGGVAAAGGNRAWSAIGKAGGLKNWKQYFINERDAYLLDIEKETNPKNIKIRKRLAEVLNELADKADKAVEKQDLVKTLNPDQRHAAQTELDKIFEELNSLKAERAKLKSYIRINGINKKVQDKRDEISSTYDKGEKFVLEQELALHELSLDTKHTNKTPERNARQALLEQIKGEGPGKRNALGANTLAKYFETIQKASELKKNNEEAIKEHQVKFIDRRRQIKLSDELVGLEQKYSEQLSSAPSDARKAAANYFTSKRSTVYSDPEFKPYLSAVEDATKKAATNSSEENIKNKEAAELNLSKAIEKYKEAKVTEVNKALTKFIKIKNDLKTLVGSPAGRRHKPDTIVRNTEWFWQEKIPEDKIIVVYTLLAEIEAVILDTRDAFPKIISRLKEIRDKLNEKIQESRKVKVEEQAIVLPPDEEIETERLKQMKLKGHMNNKQRKIALAQITKQAEVKKLAQEAMQETTATDVDAQAKEYTKNLFMKLWDNADFHLVGED